MIKIKILTAGDERKDKITKKLIDRKLHYLTELAEQDYLDSLLTALDLAIEHFRNTGILKKQKLIIDFENWRQKKSINN